MNAAEAIPLKSGGFSLDALKDFFENTHEKYFIELKKASELPTSFWESYSSFCNTSGGIIILGVAENRPKNTIIGVGNPERTLTNLWDQLSNRNKVSYRNVDNQDVRTYTIDGKTIITVYVKEAAESMKPVYINDKLENTWIRTGDGDRKATKDELAALIRNAQPAQDTICVDGFTIEDLDVDSLITFKERVSKRYPKQRYIEMDNVDFLLEIGACAKDRASGEIKLKRGTLLFLGKVNAITEVFPHYHLDFFNRKGDNSRWSDRVSDDEPSDFEMNLYNFFNIVYEKIRLMMRDEFALDQQQLRIPLSDFDETLRECLVNCLAHADYIQGYPSTKIDVYDGWLCFVNPGKMLVSTKQFISGGDSRPRNEIVMKLFRLLGASERQGFGGPLIFKTALKNEFRRPEIITDIEHTELHIWNIDLADSYPNLTDDEKAVLRFIVKSNRAMSVNAIKSALGLTEYSTRKAVQSLEELHLLTKTGNGPATRYVLVADSIEFFTQLQVALDSLRKLMV